MNRFMVNTLCVLIISSVVGCNKKTEGPQSKTRSQDQINTKNTPTENDVQTRQQRSVFDDMAEMVVDNGSSVLYSYKSSLQLTPQQKSCIDNIDTSSIVALVKKSYQGNFTEVELKKALAVFNSPEVVAMTKYGKQMMRLETGETIPDPMPEPATNDKAIQAMQAFAETEVGKKMAGFVNVNLIMKKAFDEKTKACGVTPRIQ